MVIQAVQVQKAAPEYEAIVAAIAAKTQGALTSAILQALVEQADTVSLTALARALADGNIQKVLALLDLPAALAPLQAAIPPALQAGATGAALATAAHINLKLRGASFVFNQLNPGLVSWLQTYSLGLIKQINQSTKDGVRQALVTGMQAGKNPRAVAAQIKQVVGLTAKQGQAVNNFRAALETMHTKSAMPGWKIGGKIDRVNGHQVYRQGEGGAPADGVLERRLRDFRYDGQLATAMKTGKPLTPAQIDKMVAAYRRKYLKYRAETIARTEAARANNVGVQNAWAEAVDSGKATLALVRKQWVVARDERLCPTCSAVPRMNPKKGVPLQSAFSTPEGPLSIPPLHPSCRCAVFIRQWEPWQLEDGQ